MKTSLHNPMLWLKKSKTNNFEDNSKSDKNSLGKILFVILLLCTLPTLSFALDLKGNISKDSTITLSQSPCNITADVVILSGATLTFEPGVIVNFMNAGYEIYVGSSASSLGKLNANGATFNGYGPVNVDELIVFRFNSTGTLNNCTFNNVSVVMNESSPTLTNNTFDNCVYPVEFQNECTPAISNLNILTTVTNKGIKLNGTVNTNWTLNNYGYPYFITAALTVNAGATFTIADNNIINTTGAFALSVGTATTSLGTLNANLVTFNGVTTGTTDQIAFKFGSTGKITNSTFTAYDITCSVSSPEIKNNTFNNAFISLTESSPTIQDNTFDNVAYPVLFIDECSPVLTNLNMLNGVTNRGIRLTGTVNTNWTLQNYGYPYFVSAALTVNAGGTFTIADNNIINTTGAFTLSVGTATTSLGTVNANLVTFNGVTSGTTDQIAFKFGSTGKITNCTFTAYDITCSVSSPEIKNNTFDNAFISLTESSPIIQNNTFDNVTYPVLFIDECSPVLSNLNMLSGVTNRGIRLTGTVNKDWTLQNYGYPYFITASITVNTGATFTIADNTVINTTGAFTLSVGTTTTSLGTVNANLVTFNGVTSGATDQIAFKFGSTGKITNCTFTAYDITCSVSSPEIKNNTFDNAFISLTESSPIIQDNTFDNVAYPVLFIDECSPVLTNLNMLSGVTNRGIRLTGTVNKDWTLQNYGYPYFVTAAMTVNAGATLNIAENDTINFTGAYAINIGSSASSLGTLNADKVILKGVTNSSGDQLAFKFGSAGKVTNCSFTAVDLTCSGSNPEIRNNYFDNAYISLTESSPTIQDNTFDNVAYPVLFIDECSPVLTNLNMLSGVTNRGIRLTGTVNTDWTLQNYGYPYFVTAAMTVNAGATLNIAENDTINFTGAYAINIGSSASSLGTLNADKVILKGVTNSSGDQLAFKFGSTGKVTNCSFTAVDLTCSASNPEIRNNYFDNAYISLTESSPTIQDNTFDNVAYPVLFIDECSPVLTNLNMLNGVTNRGIRLTGTVNKDWTLQNYSYPYFMTSTLTVNTGATFTIAKGDTIKIVAGYALAAGTSTTSLGTILADSVIFQGVTNTTSDQLAFRFGSTGKITNCSFTAIDITSTISSPEIRNNSFNNAFISLNESSAEIHDNTFDNVTYPVEFVNECTPVLTNLNMLSGVANPGIKLSGIVNTDWILLNYGYVYYLPTALTVNTGASFTSAQGNTIFFNGVNLAVGSSTSSIGKFYAKANSFRNMRTTDNIIYFRYGAEGVLDSCDFIGIRIHTDASNPKITRSKFHKSQNAFYTANNANPEILNNIFYNNTLALKNAGTNTITAKNNYWGHKSGPMHPNNPNGIGEKIEGLVDFSDISEKPVYGNTVYSISTNTLAYDSIPVGNFQDKIITLKSFGDIDLLFADILTPNPSFLIQIPASKRAWIEKDDSLNFTVRFKPQEPIEYDINAFVRTNNINESEIPLHLTGNGLPILKITPDSISFDSVYYGNTHIQYIKIENVSSSNSIMVDSIVNTNHKFLIYKTITPALSKIKAETETAEVAEATETRIITNGFSVSKTTPAYIAVQYLPYQSLNDEDEISIYYNAGALHKIKVKSSTYADELSTKVISLDARQFPNIYMNVQVDTFAVSHNGLTEKDIEVYENGVLQTEGFKVIPPGQGSNTRLTDIVFMMDNSGSMSDEQAQVRNNVSNFVSNLSNKGIDYAIGLCRYGASENAGNPIIEDNGALSLDYQYFRDVVWNRNVVSGGTEPGYYAIMQSASNFKFRSGSQKIFIIITDETPQQGSIGKLQLAIEACINQKITLYAFTMTDLFHLFTPITNVTNGRVFNITSSFDLILDYISNMVTNNYVIQYTSSEPVLNGVRRNVEVKVKYQNIEASDTTSYVPGAIPKITRTSPTLQLHNKAWEPGTQLTIEVEVKDDIEPFVNSVTLYCRTTKTSTYTAIQMTSTDNVLYRGTIPASLVLEPGVEYYITATDGVTSSDAPSIDAINNPYQIAVLPNTAPVIEHTPVTEGYFRNDIIIHALVTDNTNFVSSVELYYRKSGQLVFNKHSLTHTGNNNYETNISGRYSTFEDIEYYIKATDDFGVSSFSGLPESPHSIKMQNASGLEINKNVNNIHIYPNPVTNGRFIISLDNTDFAQNFRITLMNATGMKLAEIHNEFLPIGSNKIPVQVKDVNSGIYFIEITTETGVYYRKLVVE